MILSHREGLQTELLFGFPGLLFIVCCLFLCFRAVNCHFLQLSESLALAGLSAPSICPVQHTPADANGASLGGTGLGFIGLGTLEQAALLHLGTGGEYTFLAHPMSTQCGWGPPGIYFPGCPTGGSQCGNPGLPGVIGLRLGLVCRLCARYLPRAGPGVCLVKGLSLATSSGSLVVASVTGLCR